MEKEFEIAKKELESLLPFYRSLPADQRRACSAYVKGRAAGYRDALSELAQHQPA